MLKISPNVFRLKDNMETCSLAEIEIGSFYAWITFNKSGFEESKRNQRNGHSL